MATVAATAAAAAVATATTAAMAVAARERAHVNLQKTKTTKLTQYTEQQMPREIIHRKHTAHYINVAAVATA